MFFWDTVYLVLIVNVLEIIIFEIVDLK